MKKTLWKIAGFVLLVFVYLGIVLPGLPFSPFLVGSAYCFTKGSPAMHDWLYNHKIFGPFLTNWVNKKVFPTKMKFLMIAVMCSSLGILWFTTLNIKTVLYAAISMLCVAIWAWRFPGSIEIYEERMAAGKRIAWFK